MSSADEVQKCALELFARKGYNSTSMREIASASGLTPGALYHYQASKEALLLDIMLTGMNRLKFAAEEALKTENDPEQKFRAVVRSHVLDHGLHRESAIVGDTELRALSVSSRSVIDGVRDQYEELWRNLIEELAGHGYVEFDHALIRFAILQMCTGVAQWYSQDGPLPIEKVAEQFADIATRMVANNRGGK